MNARMKCVAAVLFLVMLAALPFGVFPSGTDQHRGTGNVLIAGDPILPPPPPPPYNG